MSGEVKSAATPNRILHGSLPVLNAKREPELTTLVMNQVSREYVPRTYKIIIAD